MKFSAPLCKRICCLAGHLHACSQLCHISCFFRPEPRSHSNGDSPSCHQSYRSKTGATIVSFFTGFNNLKVSASNFGKRPMPSCTKPNNQTVSIYRREEKKLVGPREGRTKLKLECCILVHSNSNLECTGLPIFVL